VRMSINVSVFVSHTVVRSTDFVPFVTITIRFRSLRFRYVPFPIHSICSPTVSWWVGRVLYGRLAAGCARALYRSLPLYTALPPRHTTSTSPPTYLPFLPRQHASLLPARAPPSPPPPRAATHTAAAHAAAPPARARRARTATTPRAARCAPYRCLPLCRACAALRRVRACRAAHLPPPPPGRLMRCRTNAAPAHCLSRARTTRRCCAPFLHARGNSRLNGARVERTAATRILSYGYVCMTRIIPMPSPLCRLFG